MVGGVDFLGLFASGRLTEAEFGLWRSKPHAFSKPRDSPDSAFAEQLQGSFGGPQAFEEHRNIAG